MNSDSVNAIFGILQEKTITDNYRRAFLSILGSGKQVADLVLSDIFGGKEESERPVLPDALETVKDYRIKHVEFNNFRYFYNEDKKDKKNFGIDFTYNGNPCSLFLVGGNGTGKSTVFAALERYYTGRSSHAEAAHVSQDDNRYLTYGFGQITTMGVNYKVTCMTCGEEQGKTNDIISNLATSASFCSDLDMQQLENSCDNLYDYVLEQLGYGDLVKLRDRIDLLGKNLQTKIAVSKDELISEEWNEIIEAFINTGKEKSIGDYERFCDEKEIESSLLNDEIHHEFRDRWRFLRDTRFTPVIDTMLQGDQGEKNLNSIAKLASMYQELSNSVKKLQENKRVVDVLDEMYGKKRIIFDKERKLSEMPVSEEDRKEVLNTLSNLLKEKCDAIIQNALFDSQQTGRNFIEEIMQRFSSSNETYTFRYENGKLSLKITVKTSTGSFEASPEKYLNTFRFKLFCLVLKMAVAFGKMRERNTVTPIVIDDVLTASDFENTIKLEQFAYMVFKTYDEILGGFGKPLQLILLTHDDMVQTAFRKGASLREAECVTRQKPSYYNNGHFFLCGRLFDKDECAKEFKDCESDLINVYLHN